MIDEIRERLQKVLEEYLTLDALLREVQNTRFRVCIFGSARIKPRDETYSLVRGLARRLARDGVDIVTGGGPGLMEAANRGVSEARSGESKSYGVTIELPAIAEVANKHLDIKSSHKRFSSRLDEFMRLTHAVIVAPGGIGTMLELMYVWQLLQVHLIEPRPVVLLGREMWGGLIDWMCQAMMARGFTSPEDLEHVRVVDTPDEAIQIIREAHRRFIGERVEVIPGPLPTGAPPARPPESFPALPRQQRSRSG
ncbi:MAG: LOG family protein [Armatimonadetes bacterium]|nr:LOG family protein [Armatimonadota bacterium]